MAIKEQIEKKLIETEVVTSTVHICNKCGREDKQDSESYGCEYLQIEYVGGYENWVIGDMRGISFDMCQYCLDDLLNSFIIPPDVTSCGKDKTWEDLKNSRPEWRC